MSAGDGETAGPPGNSSPTGTTAVNHRQRRLIWGAAIVAFIVLVAGGSIAVAQALRSRYDVPNAQLLNTGDPSAPAASPAPTATPGADITGPLNLLIVGVDTRVNEPDWQPHADSVLILHISKNLDKAYLNSIPRDLVVSVPAFTPAGFGGGRMKLTEAMSYGSVVRGKKPDAQQGFRLLATTVSKYTGIKKFDAGAVLNFQGFSELVDVMGGIELTIDQRVASIHRRPDGSHRAPNSNGSGYVGPQMVYQKGKRTLNGWQALDYARQRYISGADYSRQRHQQQMIKALLTKAINQQTLTNPIELDRILSSLDKMLVFDGQGQQPIDFAFALSGIKANDLTLVGLPGGSVISGGAYRGEQLKPIAKNYFKAVRDDTVAAFLTANPTLVNKG